MNGSGEAGRGGLLIVLACHGVYEEGTRRFYGEHPEDLPVYERQLRYAFEHAASRSAEGPQLITSGAPTKPETTRSEGASYLDWARVLGILPVGENVASEDFALTSTENLLFSLYRYHQLRGAFPAAIHAISWAFKRDRFVATLDAINASGLLGPQVLPAVEFFGVGNLSGSALRAVEVVEQAYVESLKSGIHALYRNPATIEAIVRRDPHNSRGAVRSFYRGYPMPF